jgi:hypothetical protein
MSEALQPGTGTTDQSPGAKPARPPAQGFTPEQRRRNLVLGSLLGILVLVMIVSEMLMFKANGFPKDPDEMERLQHRTVTDAPAPPPAPAPAAPQSPTQGSR